MDTLTVNGLRRWLENYAAVLTEKKDYLTQLDSPIGDADHGANMQRGFAAVLAKLPSLQDKDLGTALKAVAMTLISTVGGASGPLYGTFFLQAGASAGARQELSPAEVVTMVEKGLAGVVQRGKAQVGDKTMVDALEPAVAAMQEALAAGDSLAEIFAKGAARAARATEETKPLVARKGRASYLGERSAGHQDPGATSATYLLESGAAAFRG